MWDRGPIYMVSVLGTEKTAAYGARYEPVIIKL